MIGRCIYWVRIGYVPLVICKKLKYGLILAKLRQKITSGPQQGRRQTEESCLTFSPSMGCSSSQPVGIWDPVASTPGIRKVPSPGSQEAATAVDITTRSFCGTAQCEPELLLDWALGDELRNAWEHPDRHKHVGWSMKVAIGAALRSGKRRTVFLADIDGEPGAACTVRYLPGKLNTGTELWKYFKEMCFRTGFPEFDTKNGMDRRMQAAEDAINLAHQKHAPGSHINVQLMAVAPEHQGKKLCSKLLRAVCKVADEHKLPTYLETSGLRNVAVYETFGFMQVERVMISDPKDKEAKTYDDFYAMLRPSA